MLIPSPLRRVKELGLLVFGKPHSANLIVERGPGLPGEWDGCLTLAYRETSGSWSIAAWPCATRPGEPYLREPLSVGGAALLQPGQYRLSHRRGQHKGRNALVQVRPVTVRRDPDRDGLLEPGAVDTGLFGINIHDVSHPNQLAGCIGLSKAHMAELYDIYGDECETTSRDVTLTVLELP